MTVPARYTGRSGLSVRKRCSGVTLIVNTGGGSASSDPGIAAPIATTFYLEQ